MPNKVRRVKPKPKVSAKREGDAGKPALKSKTNKKTKIKNKEVYGVVMKEINSLMKKGEDHLSQSELNRLQALAEAAEAYEDTHEPLPVPSSLPEMIRMKMFQLQLNQQFAARLLGISEAKFSLIMNGKQKPDIYFIKAIHDKLKVDANLILQAV